jgi:cation diffusion facilitator family transporter
MFRDRKSLGYFVAGLSVIINLFLFIGKYWVGIEYSSIAMEADAWHTLSDTLTSLIVILGFWISSKPPDKHHPFGHGRAEAIGALMIGTLLAMVAFSFFTRALDKLQRGESANFGDIAIIVFLFSVVIKETLARYTLWVGKNINSPTLIADGWHHRSDAIASGLIVAGALAGTYYWWIDGIMALGVSLLIGYATFTILRNVIGSLLGESPDPSLAKKIKDTISQKFPMVSHVHHIHTHRYGDHVEVTLHIMLPGTMNLKKAHDIAAVIEDELRVNCHVESTVHIDPLTG